jgi:hypothetical protein
MRFLHLTKFNIEHKYCLTSNIASVKTCSG